MVRRAAERKGIKWENTGRIAQTQQKEIERNTPTDQIIQFFICGDRQA